MNHTAHFAVLATLLFAGATVFAADTDKSKTVSHTIKLKSGKVLENAVVLDKKPNGVTLGYKEGAAFVPYTDMPTKAQEYFGYDPDEAAKYEKKIEDQKKAEGRNQQVRHTELPGPFDVRSGHSHTRDSLAPERPESEGRPQQEAAPAAS